MSLTDPKMFVSFVCRCHWSGLRSLHEGYDEGVSLIIFSIFLIIFSSFVDRFKTNKMTLCDLTGIINSGIRHNDKFAIWILLCDQIGTF